MNRLGLDPGRLAFGLRNALAAAGALLLAWQLGLEHPQWAAMTVWATSQPLRAHLVEKSLFRGIGTVVGAVYGVLLTAAAMRAGGPPLLVVGVSAWLGLCAGAGNLLRGFAGYGALLAGFSAVMVALLDADHPQDVVGLGLDRSATVFLGILVSLAVGLALTPRAVEAEIPRRLRIANARILRDIAETLRTPPGGSSAAPLDLLSELARLDDEVDGEAAGSLAARREARNRRRMLMAQVAAILWLDAPTMRADPGLAEALDAVASDFEANAPPAARRVGLARAARLAEPRLRRVLASIGAALPRDGEAPPAEDVAAEPLALHRDWVAAREAGVRAAATVATIGVVWLLTGWPAGPLVMLGAAIMTSVFSTFDNPFAILPKVLVGSVLGALAALACRWLVWPHAGGEVGLIVAMLPFVALGGALTGFPRIQVQAFDYNMTLLLLLQPAWPPSGSFLHSLVVAASVACAPVIAWVAFRLIHPPSAERRRAALARTMVNEVEAMAARPAAARQRVALWRARLYHRLLRLVRWSDKLGTDPQADARGGLALLRLGQAVIAIEARLASPGLDASERRRLVLALRRTTAVAEAPGRSADALAAVARAGGPPAAAADAAASAVRASAGFLTATR